MVHALPTGDTVVVVYTAVQTVQTYSPLGCVACPCLYIPCGHIASVRGIRLFCRPHSGVRGLLLVQVTIVSTAQHSVHIAAEYIGMTQFRWPDGLLARPALSKLFCLLELRELTDYILATRDHVAQLLQCLQGDCRGVLNSPPSSRSPGMPQS